MSPLVLPIILESKWFGIIHNQVRKCQIIFNHVILHHFISLSFPNNLESILQYLESIPKKLEPFPSYLESITNRFQKSWKNSKIFGIISKKTKKIPNNLELISNHFQKSWKNSKTFGIICKKNGKIPNSLELHFAPLRAHFVSIWNHCDHIILVVKDLNSLSLVFIMKTLAHLTPHLKLIPWLHP